jgi:hypothetical protein
MHGPRPSASEWSTALVRSRSVSAATFRIAAILAFAAVYFGGLRSRPWGRAPERLFGALGVRFIANPGFPAAIARNPGFGIAVARLFP